MAGDLDGAEEAFAAQGAQAAGDAEEAHEQQVSGAGGSGGGAADAVDYERAIGERDARIAELEAQVAEAAKNAEAAEPWLFSQPAGASRHTSQNFSGTTGVEPAGAAGGSDERDLRRWESIAGLTEEEA